MAPRRFYDLWLHGSNLGSKLDRSNPQAFVFQYEQRYCSLRLRVFYRSFSSLTARSGLFLGDLVWALSADVASGGGSRQPVW